ncbi:unnamed protein product, partial [Coregonus sp. 'balchen']
MGTFSAWSIFIVVSLLAVKVLSQENGDFDLSDALGDGDVTKAPAAAATPKPKLFPSGAGLSNRLLLPLLDSPPMEHWHRDLDLLDFFGEGEKITTTKAPSKVPPKVPATKTPLKPKPKPDNTQADFDFGPSLRPGLLPRATKGPRNPPRPQPGGAFSDDDLFGVGNDDTYNPDKGKDTMAETGTIAGIISAVGVALVGAVTSYISYQKKKFCFSIQQSLNADLVKTDNPDAVVATEPQVW